jgi:transmembrane sensor
MTERFAYLFKQYTQGNASFEEENEFMQLAEQPEYKDSLEKLIHELFREVPGTEVLPHESMAATLQAIFLAVPAPVVAIRRNRYWIRAAAVAAVLLLLLGTSIYFISRHDNKKDLTKTTIPVEQDVAAPGHSRATLILSNGQRIALDSAGNGVLATQGKVQVEKPADGQIVYAGAGDELSYNTLSNPRGSKPISISLADGSRVWLNAESSLRYPVAFTGSERKVEISGEAYFEVSHNTSSPFIVQRGDLTVNVLGTSFNVNTYADEAAMNVTLLEGRVQVVSRQGRVVLRPGQQARIKDDIKVMNDVNTDQVMAWKNGLFNFHDVKLEAAMRQLARWYDIEVIYEKGIPDIEFGGTLKQNLSLGSLLHVLEISGVHFRIEPDKKLIVLPE